MFVEKFGNTYYVIDLLTDSIFQVALDLVGYEPKQINWFDDYCVITL